MSEVNDEPVILPAVVSLVGKVMEVTSPRQYPIVESVVLDEAWEFAAERDIQGPTVTIYPPDVVVVRRVIDGGKHLVCRFAGGPLCVIARGHLKPSEVKFL